MRTEDVKDGMTVRAAGYPKHGEELRIIARRPDAPVMVVREVVVHCSWFADGTQHTALFKPHELEPVEVA